MRIQIALILILFSASCSTRSAIPCSADESGYTIDTNYFIANSIRFVGTWMPVCANCCKSPPVIDYERQVCDDQKYGHLRPTYEFSYGTMAIRKWDAERASWIAQNNWFDWSIGVPTSTYSHLPLLQIRDGLDACFSGDMESTFSTTVTISNYQIGESCADMNNAFTWDKVKCTVRFDGE